MRSLNECGEPTKAMTTEYITPYQLCKRWANAITPKTLANWRVRGRGPAYVRFVGRVLYPMGNVLEWEKANAMPLRGQRPSS